MVVFLDDNDINFPAAEHIDEHGIIAIGGDFSYDRLLLAYSSGIFPWPHPKLPILWFCPDPRFILRPQNIIITRSLAKEIKKSRLTIKADTEFCTVMRLCQAAKRPEQTGTWISDDMINGYHELFKRGFAHSIEAYHHDRLVGGLYGVSIGSIFFGESMFFLERDASKICLVTLVAHLMDWHFTLIDCQAPTNHLERFGAEFISRKDFLKEVALNSPSLITAGPWRFYMSPAQALTRIRQT